MMGYFSIYSGSNKPTILRFFQRLLSENIFNLLDKLVWQTSLELDEEKLYILFSWFNIFFEGVIFQD